MHEIKPCHYCVLLTDEGTPARVYEITAIYKNWVFIRPSQGETPVPVLRHHVWQIA
jgi:hypothetical protein